MTHVRNDKKCHLEGSAVIVISNAVRDPYKREQISLPSTRDRIEDQRSEMTKCL
jgi:hypothetical protein